ncbi:NicO-domain-containing protein [Mycena vulgaris]|nr:NicO-domain-containing protein [Mycena vulgaris]
MMLRLTLFGRSLLLMSSLLLANAICWIVAGILFGRKSDTQPLLSLALLAWTLGLRHALDADHISAIDNATRGLINMGQLPVTCGLFFSLGHSSIVIAVNVAIAISTSIYDKLDGVGNVGGIVGAAVSGSFLFIVGLANSIILWRIMRQRQRAKRRLDQGLPLVDEAEDPKHTHMLMMRILGPVITFVNRPWKVSYFPTFYPLFSLSTRKCPPSAFPPDSVSTPHRPSPFSPYPPSRKRSDGSSISSGYIVILPLLFTAGMTILDSADSVIMLYSYSGFPERTLAIFDAPSALPLPVPEDDAVHLQPDATGPDPQLALARDQRVKANVMSGLSIILTLMSIFVAFSISLITIMGLIGNQCARCRAAAEAPEGGGLSGKWWRSWANANDNSGYIGAAIVGSFVAVVVCWYTSRRVLPACRARRGA